ncbi:hypothetical protein [Candidatus Nucleicultrix amoebiphila]|jgi:hypothetical protein|uniref:Uncharacterized protein n=1 Tax=Candidatus Nucleicultrix amoebiphila FS5 TaxID=1414854 RepID=A0A1W6N4S8_9PROT|nr:hypothetical protein [Candidatus Nucleicultrix amoebiphila]ARN84853.1 hypothetical protein GQ61_05635 [Candidatus Nucleicultrix amoebiphila FS5]
MNFQKFGIFLSLILTVEGTHFCAFATDALKEEGENTSSQPSFSKKITPDEERLSYQKLGFTTEEELLNFVLAVSTGDESSLPSGSASEALSSKDQFTHFDIPEGDEEALIQKVLELSKFEESSEKPDREEVTIITAPHSPNFDEKEEKKAFVIFKHEQDSEKSDDDDLTVDRVQKSQKVDVVDLTSDEEVTFVPSKKSRLNRIAEEHGEWVKSLRRESQLILLEQQQAGLEEQLLDELLDLETRKFLEEEKKTLPEKIARARNRFKTLVQANPIHEKLLQSGFTEIEIQKAKKKKFLNFYNDLA